MCVFVRVVSFCLIKHVSGERNARRWHIKMNSITFWGFLKLPLLLLSPSYVEIFKIWIEMCVDMGVLNALEHLLYINSCAF